MQLRSELNARPKRAPIQITRTRRKAVIDEIGSIITLYDETLRLEITPPSILTGLKGVLSRLKAAVAGAFSPPLRGYCYVA
jgi:hypothetical protein